MYAAVPRIMPIWVACAVTVGELIASTRDVPTGSIALARPKSRTFTVPSGADLDVRRLQIAVDDVLLVRGVERVGDLLRDRQRLVERDRAARDPRRQVVAVDQFHDQGGEVRCLLEAVDRRDVRMVESREHFGFALKAREAIRIAGHRGRQHLDRHRPLQIAVGGAIDLAHAAGTDLRGDFVDAKAGAGSEGQTAGV